jgi:Photosynthetic reaction centre cytochrome C subunit
MKNVKPLCVPPPRLKLPAGPDAVSTNLVTTVCASCHTLDRIRNKVADKDAWTATVTRMKAANLKVLTAQNVEFAMQNMTFALVLRCIDCHEMNDLALDTKPQKVKARMMLEMVRDINAKFEDGKTHVTCWTCHRGSTQPQIARPIPQ